MDRHRRPVRPVSDQPHSWAGWSRLPFRPISTGAARAAVFLFAVSLLIGALNFLWTSRVVNASNHRVQALCRFDADLGSAPVVAPATGPPSLLGVSIVSDARVAWHQAGCSGRLAAPAPSFVKWARYYHLPAG
jgi:hypothetical protein